MINVNKTISYNNAPDFVFPSTIEISGSVARLKDVKPANATFYAGYHVDFDGEYGNGLLTGTPGTSGGTAAIVNGALDVSTQNCWVSYDVVSNVNPNVGTIRFKYIPQYSGTPAADSQMMTVSDGIGDFTNLINIIHAATGNIFFEVKDSAGINIFSTFENAWSVVLGQEYEIEMDYDFTAGDTKLFIDGVQFSITHTETGTRTATVGNVLIGVHYGLANGSSAMFREVIFFDTVQHTSDFSSEIPRADQTQYSNTSPAIIMANAIFANSLNLFSEVVSKPATTDIKYVINVNGVDKYWAGSAWATSSGVGQSNTASDISTNASSLSLSSSSVKIKAYLISPIGNVRPTITSNTFNYGVAPMPVTKTTVFGFVYGIDGNPLSACKVSAKLSQKQVYSSSLIMGLDSVSTFTDNSGAFSLDLVETDDMSSAKYFFTFEHDGWKQSELKEVPNVGSINYVDL